MTLSEFLVQHREELCRRAQVKAQRRAPPRASAETLEGGVPLFLDQLVGLLQGAEASRNSDIGSSAATHGGALHAHGFSVGQVVHGYGDLCQAVTELASELEAPITTEEFHLFNRCLDDAIARAVTEHERLRDVSHGDHHAERLGELAHELRNSLNAATLAYTVLREGHVGINGSTGDVLGRSLRGLQQLINRSLASVRLEVGGEHRRERILVRDFVEEVQLAAMLVANDTGIGFDVDAATADAVIEGDLPILSAALMNLLTNAFKFTHKGGRVLLTVTTTPAHVVFDVEDECGGLPAGTAEKLFEPFTQMSANREGLGLGLAICRSGVQANGGEVRVADRPGHGCVFTIILPRATSTPSASS